MSAEYPSSGAPRHLLPQGEKGGPVFAEKANPSASPPSPLVGEGARRADEGYTSPKHGEVPRLLRGYARSMRHEPTEAERRLWLLLRNRRFVAYKFRRQVPIGPYIADFVCYSARLIVEADGSQHAENSRDLARDAELQSRGFRLLRFWNNDILSTPDTVSDTIWAALMRGSDQ